MSNPNRILNKRRNFLRSLRLNAGTLATHLKGLEIEPWVLSRWFCNPVFRRKLNFALRDVRGQGDIELDLVARSAIITLARMINGEISFERLKVFTCIGVIDLQQKRRAILRAGKRRGRGVSKPKPDPEARFPRAHPSLSEKEASAVLKRLYARQIEGDSSSAEADERTDANASRA